MKIRSVLLSVLLTAPALILFGMGCGSSSVTSGVDAGALAHPDGSVAHDDGGSVDDGSASDADISDASSKADADAPDAFVWPDCLARPSDAPSKSVADVWSDEAIKPAYVWVPGVYITAISHGGCAAGQACQIFLQSDLTYGSLTVGAHHAIRVLASAATSSHFVGLKVGDQVDALGWGWRYDVGGQNEVLLQVNAALPGCAHKIGTGTALPIDVALTDLSVAAYEDTYGPLLVKVSGVSGTPAADLSTTFGLYPTGGFDAGGDIVSLSPYFLANGTFVNPPLSPTTKSFSSITGVFGLFSPGVDAGPAKYLEIYPRTSDDLVLP